MMQMSLNIYYISLYVVWWALHVRGCVRRWRQPLLRGPEWFFNVRVQPGFYSGPGRKIFRAYLMRMFLALAVEIPFAVVIFISGHLAYLNLLILGMMLVIHLNHVVSVDRAERQAQQFAAPETEQPVASVALSLKPRRVSDYSNPRLERVMLLATIITFVWLVRYYFSAPERHRLVLVFAAPVFLLYVQLGFILAKRIIVAWRTPAPQNQAEKYMEAREEARKFYLRQCDINLILCTAQLVLWPVVLRLSPTRLDRLVIIWLMALLVFVVVASIWQEIRRKQVLAMALRTQPVTLPDFQGQSESSSWPLCYQPSMPMLVVKNARGYSLNLGNTLNQLSAVYLAGFIVFLMVMFRMSI